MLIIQDKTRTELATGYSIKQDNNKDKDKDKDKDKELKNPSNKPGQLSSLRAAASSLALNARIWLSSPPWEPGARELTFSETLRSMNSSPAVEVPACFGVLASSSTSAVRFWLRSRAKSRLWRELLMVERV